MLPKEVLNTIVRTNTQPQQQTTSNVVPVNNTPTNVARPTQEATVVPPPNTYTPSTTLPPLTNTTNSNIISSEEGELINGLSSNRPVQQDGGKGSVGENTSGNIASLEKTRANGKSVPTSQSIATEPNGQGNEETGEETPTRIAEAMKKAEDTFGETDDYKYSAWLTTKVYNMVNLRYRTTTSKRATYG